MNPWLYNFKYKLHFQGDAHSKRDLYMVNLNFDKDFPCTRMENKFSYLNCILNDL